MFNFDSVFSSAYGSNTRTCRSNMWPKVNKHVVYTNRSRPEVEDVVSFIQTRRQEFALNVQTLKECMGTVRRFLRRRLYHPDPGNFNYTKQYMFFHIMCVLFRFRVINATASRLHSYTVCGQARTLLLLLLLPIKIVHRYCFYLVYILYHLQRFMYELCA